MLKHYTIEHLAAEIERRKQPETKRPDPIPINNVRQEDMTALYICCNSALNNPNDDDAVNYVYEAAMRMVYGDGVWKYMYGTEAE